MKMYLQFGYGMMEHCKHFIEKWNGGLAILSPRDLGYSQMQRLSTELHELGGEVAVDPQFYLPHADHGRLTAHAFWPSDYETAHFNQDRVNSMLQCLNTDYNRALNCSFFILPGIKASEIDDHWFNYHDLFVKGAVTVNIRKPLYQTICLSSTVLQSEGQIHDLLEYLEAWSAVDGYYIVPQPPEHNYLIEDPVWLVNLMELCAGIKSLSKKVVVGYSNHQMLCLGACRADALASGTWLNVRSFNEEKFNVAEDSTSRRSLWYYCPQALSEYQVPFLDMAHRTGRLKLMETDKFYNSPYASVLFGGAQPSTVNFTERESFRQYLQCLKVQTENVIKATYAETIQSLRLQFETSNRLVGELRSSGIRAGNRDFSNVADFTLSAIDVFHQNRRFLQDINWNR
jgi:hypothetical protein